MTTTTTTTKYYDLTFIFSRGVQNCLNCFSGLGKIFLKTKINGNEIGQLLVNNKKIKWHYHLARVFLSFHWPRAHHVPRKLLPSINGLLVRSAVV